MTRTCSGRLAITIATISLAVMVVMLGAAAKHSQFESPGHGTHYLTQSVKMVAGCQAIVARPACFPAVFAGVLAAAKLPAPVLIPAARAVASPLLI